MITAFISDIHGNVDALDVVLADMKDQAVDRVICLGDIVGYGPDPNDCVLRVRDRCAAAVAGNHDYAALERMDTLGFNEYARAAADWTAKALNTEATEYLSGLSLSLEVDGLRAVHACPVEPERWTYVLSFEEARRQFSGFAERLCFIGHSHLPVIIEMNGDEINAFEFTPDVPIRLHADRRYLVNVGSVGQPRDRDPRTGYTYFDDEMNTVVLRRLPYPVEKVQKKILDAGLPPFLAQRLADGV